MNAIAGSPSAGMIRSATDIEEMRQWVDTYHNRAKFPTRVREGSPIQHWSENPLLAADKPEGK